ncbi:MAG: hypothetical protein DRR08_21105 [Candidatus Parabeggiatoa sp. nov. 2]|nr:MAG: hypothetical protein B6247_24635 [Beggiatoa sp. 4572_84]RKZ56664.1 MAG: hypothetical protein DRR08_21105 [Gammaproteobacteria bacterium]
MTRLVYKNRLFIDFQSENEADKKSVYFAYPLYYQYISVQLISYQFIRYKIHRGAVISDYLTLIIEH